MWRYQIPGYELQLLGELQRQQNGTLFCDTVLQTDGVSVPTHSCVLAALSPYLSQRLLASPSPPAGQQWQLPLPAVDAQTLVKLVGLLYSGKLEVKGSIEQKNVLAAARLLGIRDLVEGWRERPAEREVEVGQQCCRRCRESGRLAGIPNVRDESRKRDVQVQAGVEGTIDVETQVEKRGCVSMWTQTVETDEQGMDNSCVPPGQTEPPSPEPVPAVAQSWDNICFSSKPPNIISPQHSPDCVTALTSSSVLSSSDEPSPVSPCNDSNYPGPPEDSPCRQLSVLGNSTDVLVSEHAGHEGGNDGEIDERRDKWEHSVNPKKNDSLVEEKRKKTPEKRIASEEPRVKSQAKMKQMQMVETAQISIKVKLKKMTTGEVWKVVSMQDPNETSSVNKESVLAVLKQDGSKPIRPQRDLTQVEPHPSTSHPCQSHEAEATIPESVAPNSIPPTDPSTTSEPQPPSSDPCTSKPNSDPTSALLPHLQGSAEESDEQIEKLLEDIMMGLNILPSANLERDCNSSDHLQPSHDGAPAPCQVPVVDSEARWSHMHSTVNAAGCVYYHGLETGSDGTSSTDAGVGCSPEAQNQPKCSSSSSAQPAASLTQEHERSPITYKGQRDRMSCPSMSLSKTKDFLHPKAPTRTSAAPMVYHSSGQELQYPTCQESSPQEEHCFPEFLAQSDGNEALSYSGSLPCMDDLRLPRCLSPLETSASMVEHQPVFNCSADNDDESQLQPPPKGLSWFAGKPEYYRILQFPLNTIVDREKTCPSSPQGTKNDCQAKQCEGHLGLNPCNVASCTGSCENEAEERRTISGADSMKGQESVKPKWKQLASTRHTLVPRGRKRKHNYTRDALGPPMGNKEVKVGDGTNSSFNFGVCSVSLSSNNILAKEREKATSSGSMTSRFTGESNLSTTPESLRENVKYLRSVTKSKVVNANQTRIRTRSFMKKTGATPWDANSSDMSPEVPLALTPMAQTVKVVSKVPKRKRGRPPKMRLEDHAVSFTDNKSHSGQSEQQIHEYTRRPKKLKEEKPRKRRNRTKDKSREVKAIPQNVAQDTFTSGQPLALWGISAQSPQESSVISQEPYSQQHSGTCSPGGTNALQPDIGSKQTLSPESANRAEADNDSVIGPVEDIGTNKRTPTVTLKEFQNLIKCRHLKSLGSKNMKSSKETAKIVQNEWKTSDETDGTYKELERDTDVTETQDTDGIKTSDVILDITFDENQNQVFTTENYRSQKDDRNTQIKNKDERQRQGQNEVSSKIEKEKETKEYSSIGELEVLDTLANTLSAVGTSSPLDGIKESEMTVMDSMHEGYMKAESNNFAKMAPLRITGALGEKRPWEQSVIGQADVEVDFSSEGIGLFLDEDNSLSYFPTTEQLHGQTEEEEDSIDLGVEEVAEITNDRRGEREHSLKSPDRALQIHSTTNESNTELCVVTDEGFTQSDSSLPQENKMVTAHDSNPQSPQRIHRPLLDFGRVSIGSESEQEDEEEEEMEVDVLVCSPDKDPQTRVCEVGPNIMEMSPEEEDEVNEIDVTGDEAE